MPSLSARRAWIEIRKNPLRKKLLTLSLSARRAWIEISVNIRSFLLVLVALRKESVDRNYGSDLTYSDGVVALRKESVDRNDAMQIIVVIMYGRSPQGERG